MSNSLVQALDTAEETVMTETDNGMPSRKTSGKALVDFFYAAGASRGQDILPLWQKAVKEDLDNAVRAALYARDVREGMGERELFRKVMSNLATADWSSAQKVLPLVPVLGRYDDLFAFINTPVERDALELYAQALRRGEALAAKWAPREKSARKSWAVRLRKHMGLKPSEYRRMLAQCTDVVETQMCKNQWGDINYSHLPSLAASRYQRAFLRRDENRYRAYLGDLVTGANNAKINAGAIYPYTIIKNLKQGSNQAAEAQWKALPNWIKSDDSFLPVIDVSGSMAWSAASGATNMDVAISLGIYCAQRNRSAFKDRFVTFSESPTWVDLSGLDLANAVKVTKAADWGMNTNIEKVFKLILEVAVRNQVPADDMPKSIIIFSDMQFDSCVRDSKMTFMRAMQQKFEAAGYSIPNIVFWNLKASGNNTHVTFDTLGTALVSGFSPSMMANVLGRDGIDPLSIVLGAIMKPRYNWQ